MSPTISHTKLAQYYVVGLVLSVLCFDSLANYAVTLPYFMYFHFYQYSEQSGERK